MVSSTCQSPSDYRGSQTHKPATTLQSLCATASPTQPQTACISALKEGQNMQASPAPRTTCEPVTTQQCLSQQAVPRLTQTTCRTSNRVQHMQPRTVPPTASIHKLQPCHSAAAIIVGLSTLNGTIFVIEKGAVYVSDPFCKFLRGCCANPAVLTAVWLHPLFRARASALSTFFLRR